MGIDFQSKVYFGVIGEAITCLPKRLLAEVTEEQMGEFKLVGNTKIYLEAVFDDSQNIQNHTLIGIGVPISSIHNRSDDVWVKEIPNDCTKDMEIFKKFCISRKAKPVVFHALTYSF